MRAVYDTMNNENRNLRKLECVSDLFGGAARKTPLLLIVEDLHWSHGRTIDHLASLTGLADLAPNVRGGYGA